MHRLFRWIVLAVATLALAALSWVAVTTLAADTEVNAVQGNPEIPPALALQHLRSARAWRSDLNLPWQLTALFEADIDPAQARGIQLHALELDPGDWKNWQQLSMIDFQLGRTRAALQELRQAAQYSSGFQVHYDLANTAIVLGDSALFWSQMQLALRMAPPDLVQQTLQDITRLQRNEAGRLLSILPAGRPEVAAAAIGFLVNTGHLQEADEVWSHLRCASYQASTCEQAAGELTQGWLNQAITPATSGQVLRPEAAPAHALVIWNQAASRQLKLGPPAAVGRIADPNFRSGWTSTGFGWQVASQSAQLERDPGIGDMVRIHLDGFEPSYELLFWQWIVVQPGQSYQLSFDAYGQNLQNAQGLQAEVCTPDNRILATIPVALDSSWAPAAGAFQATRAGNLLRVNFVYRRPTGVALMQGDAWLRSVALRRGAGEPE